MILCCGEALIDMLPRETRDGEPAFAPFAGGAVFNTAIALGRLGAPVEFFTGLSTDLFGDLLRETLAQSHVGARYAHVAPRPTTLAFVKLSGGQASYVFYDENTAGSRLSEADLPDLDDGVSALLFGGISLITEPAASAYEALMAREHGRRVLMLDPNIRPSFIKDQDRHREKISRMIRMADVLKISDEDLAWLSPGPDPIPGWLAGGVKLVVVTRGAKGASGYSLAGPVEVKAPSVEVIDTVGAGDTFNAGLLASLHENGLLSRPALAALTPVQIGAALKLAVKAAAITVSRAGANPPWRAELGSA